MKRHIQGSLVKCSITSESYHAFVPNPLPPKPEIDLAQVSVLLDKANQAIGALNGVIETVIDPSIINYMYVRKEAVFSSQIEGTQSTLDDLLKYESNQTEGIPVADASEVSSYVAALNHGLIRIKEGFPDAPYIHNLDKNNPSAIWQQGDWAGQAAAIPVYGKQLAVTQENTCSDSQKIPPTYVRYEKIKELIELSKNK